MTGSSAVRSYDREFDRQHDRQYDRRYDKEKRQGTLHVVDVKRNPYLVNYQEKQRRPQSGRGQNAPRERREIHKSRRNCMNHQAYTARQKRAEKKRRMLIRKAVFLLVYGLVLFVFFFLLVNLFTKVMAAVGKSNAAEKETADMQVVNMEEEIRETYLIQGLTPADYGKHPTWTEDFLTPNEYSRPGDALKEVNSVFVHYTANPGTSAAQNRSYFEQQKDTHECSVSAHFIIGYEGEIIQCVPLDEIAYAVQTRNEDSISIECCYLAEDGSFTQETYDSLIKLLKWLVEVYDLEVDEDILRHYDCGGKKCPIYYTEHEDAWEMLKEDVKTL